MKHSEMINLNDAFNLVTDKIITWTKAGIKMLPNIALAIVIIVAFYFLARLLRAGVRKVDEKISGNKAVMRLVANLVFSITIGLGIFAALSVLQLDKTVTSLLAGAGIIGLALGFAFQETAANFLSGVLMAIRKPIRIGDIIESNDSFGRVSELNLRATIIRSFDGQDIIIPNKEVLYSPIKNYTTSGVRRLDLKVGVSYGDDLEKVRDVTIEALRKIKSVDDSKEIMVWFEDFGDSSINFTVALWMTEIDQPNYRTFKSDAVMAIKSAFDANDITIPYPIRTLDFGIKGGEKLDEMKLHLVEGGTSVDQSAKT